MSSFTGIVSYVDCAGSGKGASCLTRLNAFPLGNEGIVKPQGSVTCLENFVSPWGRWDLLKREEELSLLFMG